MTDDGKIRLDKWLWAARFFKTRALAAEAINGGKIHLNAVRAKPAHAVKPGDELRIRKGPFEFMVSVTAVARIRGPASAAAMLYEETPQSIAARERLAEQHRLLAAAGPQSSERPTKRQRRQITRFTGRGG